MKKTVRLVLTCALLIFTPTLVMAQMEEFKSSTPEERAAIVTQTMQSSLALDTNTTTAVSEINLKYAKETQALMDSSSPKLEKLMAFKKNAQAKDNELKAILTPEQYNTYLQKKSEMEATIKQQLKEKYQATP